ncbi:ferrochelatase [Blastopirellula marina]|uniref:Ferrochelatase n=1 Tax=Blastopirellula marina TaxID=124 RepID=A0A2S8FNH3_9BACT|nr:ferrochelatase [Blastopirellula marina]PQO33741.1 ferrochelatase [Blastopirellula marina]PTL43528.1 ferrochelatase [Blastopirellula marina]
MTDLPYDALLLLSFGGPEKPDDVIPFLENVLRGRNVPRERMLEVAEHYYHFGGKSPINDQNRALIEALTAELKQHEIDLPIYWGNRNWHPLLTDTMQQMHAAGVRRALVFVTSIFSSYSGCRQYREDIQKAQAELGLESITFDKIRTFYNHPAFIETMADRVRDAIDELPAEGAEKRKVLFTAHSIPNAMASNCDYEKQLEESSRLIAEAIGIDQWSLVYQSRSGPPNQPWLEPDVCDAIRQLADSKSADQIVLVPVGFVSDHMEVIYDLDDEAANLSQQLGIPLARAKTAGTHPTFVAMIRQLIEERLGLTTEKRAIGKFGPSHDVCPANCCRFEPRRPATSRPTE